MALPFLVFSDAHGAIYNHPYLRMACGNTGFSFPKEPELVTAPKNTTFFYMPGRKPVGFNPAIKRFEVLTHFEDKEVFAVSAFLPPGWLRLYNPAFVAAKRILLPLWAYTACGFQNGKFVVAATRIDRRVHQEERFYDCKKIKAAVNVFLKRFPENRLYRHLAHCALNYNCLNAKNLFLQRWEGGIPTSQHCNARCLGCISLQKNSPVSASHERLKFTPTSDEIAEVMANHLEKGSKPIVSFGQGCEGEPLLQSDNVAVALAKARQQTLRGTVHMNTNGSMPGRVKDLCLAGMDSFRFSLNSANENMYGLYFRPQGYKFRDVVESIMVAKKYKKFVSINLLAFPGVTDSDKEMETLIKFIKNTRIDMIQWRNLNIDPAYYLEQIPQAQIKPLGLLKVIKLLKKKFPCLKHGYFNRDKTGFL
jgi:pyruvate-formate lyase-activating enzyme